MNKHILILIAFIFLAKSANSQTIKNENSIVIYSNKNAFLVPNIESILSELKDTLTNTNIFNKIIVFNRIEENMLVRNQITNRASSFDIERLIYNMSKARQLDYSKIGEDLRNFKKLLLIDVNFLSTIIEYHMTLYETFPNEEQIKTKSIPVVNLKSHKSITFFIDPTKENNTLVENSIKKLFLETNFRPKALIKCSNGTVNNTIVGVGDTLKFDATSSFDEDTPVEKLKYKWRLLNSELSYQDYINNPFQLNSENPVQALVFKSPGFYKFGLIVFDGITSSLEDTLSVTATIPPIIYAPTIKKEVLLNKYFFQSKNKKFYDDFYIYLTNDNNANLVTQAYDNYQKKAITNEEILKETYKDFYESKIKGLGDFLMFETKKIVSDPVPIITLEKPILLRDTLNTKLYKINYSANLSTYNSKIEIFTVKDNLRSNLSEIDVKINTKNRVSIGIDWDILQRTIYLPRYNLNSSGILTNNESELRYSYLIISPFINLHIFRRLTLGISFPILNHPPLITYNNYDMSLMPKIDSINAISNKALGAEAKSFQFSPLGKIYLIFPFGSLKRSLSFSSILAFTANYKFQEKAGTFDASLNPDILIGFRFQYSFHKKGLPFNIAYTYYGSLAEAGASSHAFSYSSSSSSTVNQTNNLEYYYLSSFTISYQPFFK